MKILIAEDQPKLREILKKRLTKDGFYVDAVEHGEDALVFAEETQYDLIILDIMMPKRTGLEVLDILKTRNPNTRILFLTALGEVQDRVLGLNRGADDYLVKPFSYDELFARIQALLRRPEATSSSKLSIGDLTLHRDHKTVRRGNVTINLTKKEYVILEYLMMHPGKVVSKQTLEQLTSTFDYEGYSNIISVYIRFLRAKIDEPFGKETIHTVRGFGYVLREEA